MATLAQLLRLPASVGYRLSRAPLDPLTLLAGVSVPLPEVPLFSPVRTIALVRFEIMHVFCA